MTSYCLASVCINVVHVYGMFGRTRAYDAINLPSKAASETSSSEYWQVKEWQNKYFFSNSIYVILWHLSHCSKAPPISHLLLHDIYHVRIYHVFAKNTTKSGMFNFLHYSTVFSVKLYN